MELNGRLPDCTPISDFTLIFRNGHKGEVRELVVQKKTG